MATVVIENITAINSTTSIDSTLNSGRICSRRTNYDPAIQMKNKFNYYQLVLAFNHTHVNAGDNPSFEHIIIDEKWREPRNYERIWIPVDAAIIFVWLDFSVSIIWIMCSIKNARCILKKTKSCFSWRNWIEN